MIKRMLSMLMDGIKDTNMILGYVEECEAEGTDASWYINHAKSRAMELKDDYGYVISHTGLQDKVREGDPIAEALMSHLKTQINDVLNRVNAM